MIKQVDRCRRPGSTGQEASCACCLSKYTLHHNFEGLPCKKMKAIENVTDKN